MIKINSLKLDIGYTEADMINAAAARLQLNAGKIRTIKPVKISVDARDKSDVRYICSVNVTVNADENRLLANKRIKEISRAVETQYVFPKLNVSAPGKRPVIVGAGPAGLFCALSLARAGLKPLLIERGADVDERTKDVNCFWESGKLNTSSNVQFGEGGAGTFSDGKLNTMVHDSEGRIGAVFEIFVGHGAPESIIYTAKPHLGTDRLIHIVKSIREEIIRLGGEVRFHSCLTDIFTDQGAVSGIEINGSEKIECKELVLAIGHSARDTFKLLKNSNIALERKAFAIGVRAQHPQKMISISQYGDFADKLPPADYKLTANLADGRGVYSFCMCPGGFVVNASSEEGCLAVNGMSNSDRSEASANSAIVVTVSPEDFPGDDVLAGVELQRQLERKAFGECGGYIPVQTLYGFRNSQVCEPSASNMPNTKGMYRAGNLRNVLPEFISTSLLEAFPVFGRKIKGFDADDTLLMGVETRTSSPVRITRNDRLTSISLEGLYPCGEGAGYAGGITSAAIDGLKTAEALINHINSEQL